MAFMNTIRWLISSARPSQWVKNVFIFIPVIFAQELFEIHSLFISAQAFLIFCMMSSAVYFMNDLTDLENDRTHPEKKSRPLAAGLLSPIAAKLAMAVLGILSILWAIQVNIAFFLIVLLYFIVQLLYNFRLKDIVILDIFCVSSGFFLRVLAGGAAIQVEISHWLIICSILLSSFLAIAKRRHELILLGTDKAHYHRKVLSEYTITLLDQMTGVITASTLLSYMLYCISPDTIQKFKTDHLIYTFPFVLYGIFRYLYLIYVQKKGGSPERIVISDGPLLLSIGLWGVTCILVIYGVI